MSRGRGVTLPDSDQLDFAFILVASFQFFSPPMPVGCGSIPVGLQVFLFFFHELLMFIKGPCRIVILPSLSCVTAPLKKKWLYASTSPVQL